MARSLARVYSRFVSVAFPMNSELLQQVRVLDPVSGTDQLADVLIAEGFIKAIETENF
jgi:predicted amidohydrolase